MTFSYEHTLEKTRLPKAFGTFVFVRLVGEGHVLRSVEMRFFKIKHARVETLAL